MNELESAGNDRSSTEGLPGTVKLYQRHVFVCTGRSDWPARIETSGGFLKALAEAVTDRASDMPLKVKVTACDEPSAGPGYDLLIFPDAVRYRGLYEADLPTLVEDHLVGNRVSGRLQHEPVTAKYVFVCIHGNRDQRCEVCGMPLIVSLSAALEQWGLADTVTLCGASHVGGHRFAGNVLVYPGGDWYGYVSPDNVSRIVDQHIQKGEIIADLWRGRMGMTPEEQRAQAEEWYSA